MQPSQTADSYIPERFASDAELRRQSPLAGGIALALERCGRPIAAHVDEITVRMPSPAEAQQLQIATGVPVVAMLRTAYDAFDAPVIATVLLMPGDRHMLRYNVKVDKPERDQER
jgi:GntR family transcriptional regulator